ncbi:MAG: hypothetical protein AAB250_04385 [Bdellovibrionota bacterium]
MKSSIRIIIASFLVATFALPALAIDPPQAAALQHEGRQKFASSFAYIIPNERQYYQFADANRGLRGTFIGVGTFRVLAGASYGDFDQVIFADLDQRVVDFNRVQIEILAKSNDVSDFLSRLARRTDPQNPTSRDFNSYADSVSRLMADDPGGSFLTDHRKFLHLRELARAGRMHSIPMSLTGSTGYEKLGRLLRKEGSTVGVIDVSNAPDYIKTESKNWGAFERNLRTLPWAPDGIVNFTTEYARGFSWDHTSVPIERYLTAMQPVRQDRANFSPFIKNLVETARGQRCAALF